MDFTATERIGAPRHAVEAAMVDPTYYEGLEHVNSNLERPHLLASEVVDGVATLSVRYAFAGDVTGAARMAVDPAKLTWVIHTRLDLATHEGILDIVPDHYADMLRCDASMRLDESGDETIETIEGTLDVRLPVFGATAERMIIDSFVKHLEAEAAALTAFCSGSAEA